MELNLSQKEIKRRFKRIRKQTNRRLDELQKQARASAKEARKRLPGYKPTLGERIAHSTRSIFVTPEDKIEAWRYQRSQLGHTADDALHTAGHVGTIAKAGAAAGVAEAEIGLAKAQEVLKRAQEAASQGLEKAQDTLQPRYEQVKDAVQPRYEQVRDTVQPRVERTAKGFARGYHKAEARVADSIDETADKGIRVLEKRAPKVAKTLGLESKAKKRQKMILRMLPLFALLGVGIFLLYRRRSHSHAIVEYGKYRRDEFKAPGDYQGSYQSDYPGGYANRAAERAGMTGRPAGSMPDASHIRAEAPDIRAETPIIPRTGELDSEAAETASSIGVSTRDTLEGPAVPPVDPGFQSQVAVPVTASATAAASMAAAPAPISSVAGAVEEGAIPAGDRRVEGPRDVVYDETISTMDATTDTPADGERSGPSLGTILAIVVILALIGIILYVALRAWSVGTGAALPEPDLLAAYLGSLLV